MSRRKTAGELVLKASADNTKYKSIDVGYALCDDIGEQIQQCINIHNKIFDMEEYCVCYVIASDPLIQGVMRRKFFAFPYLPSPRPEQTVFLYNKVKDKLEKRLWALPRAYSHNPEAWTMEKLYLTSPVPKEYENMKKWSMAFYNGFFWEFIRKQHDITMLSETEFLNANREKLIKAGCKDSLPTTADSFDFGKIAIDKIIDTKKALVN